jgi:fermentation-respiration switch protein FrsA (DUF1100 family)
MIRLAGTIVLVGLFGYLAILALVYSQQRRLLFPASPIRVSAAQAGLHGVSDVALRTPDGETLVAWWKPPETGRALLLYFHGNGGSLLNRRDRFRMLAADGRGLLMVSYRGYSGSTGSPSEEGLHVDAQTAYAWLGWYQPDRIVLYGESLGTGVAIRLASEVKIGALILDAPYTSTADIAKTLFWYMPITLLMRDQFRSIDRIAHVEVPILMMHGEEDGVVPIAQSRILFAAAKEPKRSVEFPGVDHESVLERGGLAEVRRFLDDVEAKLRRP